MGALAQAAPTVPADDRVVLERLPVKPNDPLARELRRLRAELARDPGDPERAVALAQRYFELAGAQGDPRFIGYAQAALQPWWRQPDPPVEVRVMRALLKQYSHDFKNALQDLEAATREDPRNEAAWSWRAAIHMVQADYDAARRACESLRPVTSELGWAGCIAYVDGTTGKAAPAYRVLHEALGRAREASPAEQAWAHTRLAELALRMANTSGSTSGSTSGGAAGGAAGNPAAGSAAAGNAAQAERHFRAALAQGVTDQFLLAAYADFLLDQGRPREVVALLQDWVRSDVLLLRLALAEKAVGARAAKEHIDALRARFEAAALRGDKLHLQEEARLHLYLLDRKDIALALAQENWTLQREPRDARILLEAALAMRDPEGAQPALAWLERSGHEDPLLRQTAVKLKALAR